MGRLTIISIVTLTTLPLLAMAHGGSADPMSGGMMGRMMEMMHQNMDQNMNRDCEGFGDEEMMERGEHMMEEMMGKDDHQRVEKALDADKNDHDAMHTMMGMWATGCVGDEATDSVMERYGVKSRLAELEAQSLGRAGWSNTIIGGLIGLLLGVAGSMMWRKKE